MRLRIALLPLGIFLFFISSCKTPSGQTEAATVFNFSEITFHTSPCFGSCPRISVIINNRKEIQVSRQFYKGKVEPDTTHSGNFKGVITDVAYSQLLTLLQKIDWDTIDFPKVMCCDAPVRTVLLSYNNKKLKFKSMTPPESTTELFQFLIKQASDTTLPKYTKTLDFEDVVD